MNKQQKHKNKNKNNEDFKKKYKMFDRSLFETLHLLYKNRDVKTIIRVILYGTELALVFVAVYIIVQIVQSIL